MVTMHHTTFLYHVHAMVFEQTLTSHWDGIIERDHRIDGWQAYSDVKETLARLNFAGVPRERVVISSLTFLHELND
jgi:hypothetical protein